MNIDYKYIAGSKDPLNILNKYRMRGFGTWLNKTEKQIILEYSKNIKFWKNLYCLNDINISFKLNNIFFGPIDINHKLYHPRLYNYDDYIGYKIIDLNNRYNDNINNNKFYSYYKYTNNTMIIKKKFNIILDNSINYDKYVAINENGDILPIKPWIINETLDYN